MKFIQEKAMRIHNSLKNNCKHPLLQCVLLSIALNLYVEIMSRSSFLKALTYLFTNPLIFLYNTGIILVTISTALFFKRRRFAYVILSMFWIAFGFIDFILLLYRTTPFTAVDILMINSALQIWQYYLNFSHILLVIVVLVVVVIGLIWFWKKTKYGNLRFPPVKSLIFSAVVFFSVLGMTSVLLKTNLLAENFGNLANAYHKYGLPYCFVNSIINTGIDKPEGYSHDMVKQIVKAVEEETIVLYPDISPTVPPKPTLMPSPVPTKPPVVIAPSTTEHKSTRETPNIIMLQLETFFDPTSLIGSSYTLDPIPTFRELKELFSSGYLSVPSIGAGTANTEFEVLTGMNLDFFGPGEYPYKTILQKTTCESISFNLKPLGYTAHALHNNTGTFYERHEIFSQLGFDTFTSLEYMNDVSYNPTNWAKDDILIKEIKTILDSTKNQDLIYAISVQGHGGYPDYEILSDPLIDVTLEDTLSEDLYYPLLYYVNQLYEMDQFILDLTEYLSSLEEETLLIMYGDHLPGFQLEETSLSNGSLFQTEYIIWSNFPTETIDRDFEAYQLTSHVLQRLGIHNGLITKLHQTQKDSDVYLEELKIMEYDMLYGDMECFGGTNPYQATDLSMGILPITVFDFLQIPSTEEEDMITLILKGKNFTPFSKIYINEEYYETNFLTENAISATIENLQSGDSLAVIQSGSDMLPLSSTKPIIIP